MGENERRWKLTISRKSNPSFRHLTSSPLPRHWYISQCIIHRQIVLHKTVLMPTFVPFDSLSRNWKFHVNCSHLDDSNNNRAERISVKSAAVHGHERVNSKEDRSLDGFKGHIDERYFPGRLAKRRAAFKHFNTGS